MMMHRFCNPIVRGPVSVTKFMRFPHWFAFLIAVFFSLFADFAQAGCISGRCSSPIVQISSPANNASFRANQDITMTGRAFGDVVFDSDGDEHTFPIKRVDIYKNGAVVGQATLGAAGVDTATDIPYRDFSYTFAGGFSPSGGYSIGAKPYDTGSNTGAGEGRLMTIGVGVAANASPTISVVSPASGSVVTANSVVMLSAVAADSDGSIVSVQYFDANTPISGLLTSAPYSFAWTATMGAGAGLRAMATDNNGATTMAQGIYVIVNDKPVSQLNVSNVVIESPASITLTTNASDAVGGIDNVRYLVNGVPQAPIFQSAPFTQVLASIPPGTYTIASRVTDTYGAWTDSAPYTWVVSAPNQAPSVALTAPANGTLINSGLPASIALSATAADSDGSVARVEFLVNGTVVSSVLTAPYTTNWVANSPGLYTVQARAIDNKGAVTTTALSLLTINSPPSVQISAPSDGAVFPLGAKVPVTINASDSDGSIAKVELYDGTLLIATMTTAPYTTIIDTTTTGSHTLKATAFDDRGVALTSSAVTFIVKVSSPPISTGSGSPGRVSGLMEVSGAGTAQYIIPIAVPPGTADMAPSIALKYDSGSGNGVAGVGWSISGLSQITRCSRDLAYDGVKSAIELSAQDRFCLDGQRLVVINGGVYGAPNSEYRTEVDSYAKIVALGALGGGPEYFFVIRRDGVQFKYGNTADSKLILPGHAVPFSWAVSQASDLRGNYYTVTYTISSATGEQLPSRIDYTGNALQPTPSGTYNSLHFVYDQGGGSRPDTELTYIVGAKIINSSRLSKLQTYAGAILVKEYRLAYSISPSTSRSRIQSVTECADAGSTCLSPTIFNWESTAVNFSGPIMNFPSASSEFGSLVVGDYNADHWSDLNGDGRPDHCVVIQREDVNTGDYNAEDLLCSITQSGGAAPVARKIGTFAPNADYTFIDINGDGIADVCTDDGCLLGSATGPTLTSIPAPGNPSRGQFAFWADINGDGRVDYCRITNDGVQGAAYRLDCYLNNGSGFAAVSALGPVPVATCGPSTCQTLRFAWADVTGDGVQSFCRLDAGAMRCRKWTPSGLAPETSTGTIDLGENSGGRAWVDVNGDGLADFCRVISDHPGENGGTGHLACTLSSGKGFGDTIVSGPIDIGFSLPAPFKSTRSWIDINGDGKADYCRNLGAGNIDASCVLSSGVGFLTNVSLPVIFGGGHTVIADVNGDGKSDACSMISNYAHCLTSAGNLPDLLLDVVDGLGATTNLSYGAISDDTLYTKGSGAVFPDIDIQDTTNVVRRLRASNGVGGTIDTTYRYKGARVNLHGRGFLGFAATINTGATGINLHNEVHQDFPYTGLTKHILVSAGGITLSETNLDYAATPGAPYQVYPVKSSIRTNDLNGAFINWVENTTGLTDFDQWGNPIRIDTIFKDATGSIDGYSTTSQISYLNDTTNWLLGRVTKLATTSRVPGQSDSTRSQTNSYFTTNPRLGLLQQTITEPNNGGAGGANLRLVIDYDYDKFGNISSKTVSGSDISSRTTATYTYDLQGRGPITSRNALNHLESFSYDWRFGVKSLMTDPNLLTTLRRYDGFGRLINEDRADGTRTSYNYNVCVSCVADSAFSIGRSETVIASGAIASPPSRIFFDTLGREIVSARIGFSGLENYRQNRYDSLGRIASASQNYLAGDTNIRWTSYSRDALGRVTQSVAPDSTISNNTYNGRTTNVINTNAIARSRSVNSQGQVVSVVDALGTTDASSMAYEYDNWGNVSKVTDAAGNVTSVYYDLRGRKFKLSDPDIGTWNYVVDSLGQVKQQTDAKNQVTTYTYDVLGRRTNRAGPDFSSNWYYEINTAGVPCANGIGQLCEATSSNGYFRRYAYDSLGRISTQTSHVDTDYVSTWAYDDAGRIGSLTFPVSGAGFPAALSIRYNYTSLGLLASISNGSNGARYWSRNAENVDGNLTSETWGNGLVGRRGYDPATGRLVSLQAGTDATPGLLLNQGYHYDGLGRMDRRQDNTTGVETSETFIYDALDRMTGASITAADIGTQTTGVEFNAIGNIVSKTDVGNYGYPAAKTGQPHAVSRIAGTVNGVLNPSYQYDANGNMLSNGARNFTWTSFNMPAMLVKNVQQGSPGSGTATFLYGPEHQRLKQIWSDSAKTLTTIYLDGQNFEKEINTQTGLAAYKHYVYANGRVVALHTRRSNATEDVRYLVTDHMGSVSVVTDAAGAVMERQAFDPWGDRRIASGAGAGGADPENALQASTTTRGYTGHEQLDQGNMGLIHMNGRVYDPTLARFISADPKVQAPYHTQSMNRYSYVWNGPLNGTDPSGYIGIITTVPVQGQALARGMGFSLACRNSGCLAPLNELQEELQPPRTSLLQKGGRELQSAAHGAKNLARIIRNSPFMKKVEGKMQGSLGLVSMPLSLLQLPLLQAAVDQASAEDAASNGLDIAEEGANTPGTKDSDKGCIYCVPGDKTSSGNDYIGSTDDMDQRKRDKSDGRDREGARIVGEYDKGNRDERRNKEQQAINDHGGVENLDNRRNERAERKWPANGITPPTR